MDFSLTEAQTELAALVRRIADDQLTQQRLKAVEAQPERFDRELWRSLADAGVLAAALPASVGGGDLDFLEQCSILIELGRAVAPVPYLPNVVSAAALAYFGTDAQRTQWAAPAAVGDLVLTAALTEEFVDETETPTTRADRDGVGWRLTGTKAVVPCADVADALLVPASTDDGVGLFIVLPGEDGVRLVPEQIVDGDHVASLELADVHVDDDRRVPGADVVHWLIARATVAHCAHQLGVLERALELTAEYARTREQFGRPIGSFQAVGQRLADAYIDVEAVRLTLWEAAWRIASGLPCPTEIATAKFWAADAGHRVAHTAVHVHGGTGIDTDGPLHRYFVAAKRNEFSLGSATDHLRALGRELADTPA
ncbi:MAG: acyl-CoA dehydrogenase family protein [Jatrophihabitantaceae bacterium]